MKRRHSGGIGRGRDTRSPSAIAAVALLTLALLGSAGGCAAVVHRPLDPRDARADEEATGIRYYESALYLLVYSDGRGGIISRVLELPDLTRPRVAEPQALLSTLEGTLEFQDGRLVGSRAETDATAIPAAVIDAVEGFVRESVAARRDQRTDGAGASEVLFPAPSLFRLEVTGDAVEVLDGGHSGLKLLGGQGDAPVRVPLGPPTGGV